MDNSEKRGFIREVIKNPNYDDETKIKMIEEELMENLREMINDHEEEITYYKTIFEEFQEQVKETVSKYLKK